MLQLKKRKARLAKVSNQSLLINQLTRVQKETESVIRFTRLKTKQSYRVSTTGALESKCFLFILSSTCSRFGKLFLSSPDQMILFPAVTQSNTKSHPTQEQPGNINWPLRYPLMDRTHFISNLTFNEYIFYLPVPVIGMSSPFREMVVLGLF